MVRTILGERALWLRKAHRLSLRGLSRRVEVSPGYLNKIERCRGGWPTLEVVLRLCRFYEVTPDYLLGFDRDERQLAAAQTIKSGLLYFWPEESGEVPRKCLECDRLLIPGKLHSFSECITFSFHRGRTLPYLIRRWTLPKDAIELIVRDTLKHLPYSVGLGED